MHSESAGAGQSISATSLNKILQAYHWDMERAEDSSGNNLPDYRALEPKYPVRIDFVAGSRPGEQTVLSKFCNTLRGDYTLDAGALKVGHLISTRIGCQDQRLATLERTVGAQLMQLNSVELLKAEPTPRIQLGFVDGSRWFMNGKPTDATRYGSAGETIFWEVAPQTRSCTSAATGWKCLQVREVRYDKGGRQSIAGDWQDFRSTIEGFTHEPGIRNVLRLKRYPLKTVAADGSSYAYVLDMAVEVERVDR